LRRGDQRDVPYRREHFFATNLERLLAAELREDSSPLAHRCYRARRPGAGRLARRASKLFILRASRPAPRVEEELHSSEQDYE